MAETAEAPLAFPELELIDSLIAGLENLIAESDETPLTIESNQKPKRAAYRTLLPGTSPSERKVRFGDAVYLNSDLLVLRCNTTEVVRLTPMEVMIQVEKNGHGETMAIVKGKARELKRVRGGYDIEIDIGEMRKTRLSPSQKLRDSLHKNDVTGWNRWCQDIKDKIELMGMDLRRADLTGYDLCCADFNGSDLSGANLTNAVLAGSDLSHCTMDKVVVTGTDFFRAKMNRAQAALLQQSGMPEVESVVFES